MPSTTATANATPGYVWTAGLMYSVIGVWLVRRAQLSNPSMTVSAANRVVIVHENRFPAALISESPPLSPVYRNRFGRCRARGPFWRRKPRFLQRRPGCESTLIPYCSCLHRHESSWRRRRLLVLTSRQWLAVCWRDWPT